MTGLIKTTMSSGLPVQKDPILSENHAFFEQNSGKS